MINVDTIWYMSCDYTHKKKGKKTLRNGRNCGAEMQDLGDDAAAIDWAEENGWTIVKPNYDDDDGKTYAYCADHKPVSVGDSVKLADEGWRVVIETDAARGKFAIENRNIGRGQRRLRWFKFDVVEEIKTA